MRDNRKLITKYDEFQFCNPSRHFVFAFREFHLGCMKSKGWFKYCCTVVTVVLHQRAVDLEIKLLGHVYSSLFRVSQFVKNIHAPSLTTFMFTVKSRINNFVNTDQVVLTLTVLEPIVPDWTHYCNSYKSYGEYNFKKRLVEIACGKVFINSIQH